MDTEKLKVRIKERLERIELERVDLTQKLHMLDDVERMFEGIASETTQIVKETHPGKSEAVRNTYAGFGQAKAVMLVLSKYSKPLSAADIATELEDGGFQFKSNNPANSIFVLLSALVARGKLKKVKRDGRSFFTLPEPNEEEVETKKAS